MTRFLRPEAMAALTRWRGVLASGGVLALGLWWALGGFGVVMWLGIAVAVAGAVLMVAAVQRMRFAGAAGGPGVVQVDEGAIAYFGPLTGGVVARSEMTALAIDRTGKPAHWALSQEGQADLMIPLTATGADALFDAFAALPGIRTERMLAEMRRTAHDRVTLWQKPGTSPRHLLLT